MNDKKDLLQEYYQNHHEAGNRLKQAFREQARGELFKEWIGKGKKILDLGGRDGTLTQHFVEDNEVTIGDIDVNAMESAKARLGVATAYVDLNAQLPFESEHYDVVVMAEVLEHLPYPSITLPEVQRILKPGGVFLGSIPLAYHFRDRINVLKGRKLTISRDPTHLQFLSYDDLTSLLNKYFQVQTIKVMKGGKKAHKWPRIFAKNVAFLCSN